MIVAFLAAMLAFDGQSISGVAVDSLTGAPLAKVEVTADNTSSAGTTNSEGRFTLKDVPPGQYWVRGRRNGYLENALQVTLEAGQDEKDVKLTMARFGVIAGTVRDIDGEPMAGVQVNAGHISYDSWGKRRLSNAGSDDTDDLGHYRILDLDPGRYTVSIDRDPGPARPVEVQTGQRAEGSDLTRTHPSTVWVSGHVAKPPGTNRASVSLSTGEGDYSINAEVKPSGDFEFAQAPPGIYTLTAYALRAGKLTTDIQELLSNTSGFKSKMPLTVGTEPIKGITIAIEPGAELTGHINVKAAGARVHFEGEDQSADAIVQDDQTFSTALQQGHFYIDRHMMKDYVVSGVLLDGRDILDEGLTVGGTSKISLEIVLTKDGGQVEGVVTDKDGKPVPEATVVLVPELSRRSHPDLFQSVNADQRGYYRIENVPTGEFRLFAWAGVEENIWWDPDFLRPFESRGVPVSIQAGSRETRPLTSLAGQ